MQYCRILTGFLLILAVGCQGPQTAVVHLPLPSLTGRILPPAPPKPDVLRIRPNELGLIPIVMYHDIGARSGGRTPRYDSRGLNIRPATFRKHLELMRRAGWFPVNMRDAMDASIDVPSGKIPVVITFDDGRASQFRYLPNGRIDPDCAVGILEEFHRRHRENWPLRATFFVMPASRWNPPPFYQSRLAARKLRYLLDRGFEIANHTTSHRSMARMDPAVLKWEIAESIRGIRKLAPGATMDTLALPYGEVPHDPHLLPWLIRGTDGGFSYVNRCALIAWGGPAYPRAHKRFDPQKLTRIGVEPGYLERWIQRLKPGKELQPYVSDGDGRYVSIPRSAVKWANLKALPLNALLVWNDLPADSVQKVARRNSRRQVH